MTDRLAEIEAALGKKILREGETPVLPGLEPKPGNVHVYFEVSEGAIGRDVYKKIVRSANPRNAQSGGASEGLAGVKTPDGRVFHTLSYRGDLDGWAKDVAIGAEMNGITLGRIEDGRLVIATGDAFTPAELEVFVAR